MTPSTPLRTTLLWLLALLLMAGTVVFQRLTGPTHPKRERFAWKGAVVKARLVRSQTTDQPARVAIPDPGPEASARLVYRRFPTSDPWTIAPMVRESRDGKAELAALLPVQNAAGKMEYRVELDTPGGMVNLPADGVPVVLRYKDPVPGLLLASHVALMFLGVLVGLRTGLSALFQPSRLGVHVPVTLGLLTLGGMILGPCVQKYAFGAYWTGWPFGGDLTDNKTLIMWGVWLAAFAVQRFRPAALRWSVALACAVMTAVYLVPHSMRGSQLDYQKTVVTTGR